MAPQIVQYRDSLNSTSFRKSGLEFKPPSAVDAVSSVLGFDTCQLQHSNGEQRAPKSSFVRNGNGAAFGDSFGRDESNVTNGAGFGAELDNEELCPPGTDRGMSSGTAAVTLQHGGSTFEKVASFATESGSVLGAAHSISKEEWMYNNDRGGKSGPYTLSMLSEGMHSGYLPDDMLIYHKDGNREPIPLRVLVRVDPGLSNGNIGSNSSVGSSVRTEEQVRKSDPILKSRNGYSERTRFNSSPSPSAGLEARRSSGPSPIVGGSSSLGFFAQGVQAPSNGSFVSRRLYAGGWGPSANSSSVPNGFPAFNTGSQVPGISPTGVPVQPYHQGPQLGHPTVGWKLPVNNSLQSRVLPPPAMPNPPVAIPQPDQTWTDRRWKYPGVNAGQMEGPFSLSELSSWFHGNFLYGTTQVIDVYNCIGPTSLSNLLSYAQNGTLAGLLRRAAPAVPPGFQIPVERRKVDVAGGGISIQDPPRQTAQRVDPRPPQVNSGPYYGAPPVGFSSHSESPGACCQCFRRCKSRYFGAFFQERLFCTS